MRFSRRLKPQTNVDLVPLIDVVFQLVVFFMVSTTFIVTPGIGLTLPASTTAEPVVMSRLVITVASQDEVYLNDELMDLPGLSEKLAELKGRPDASELEKTVVLEADKEVPYRLMIEVLDILRKNGYRGVNLKTRKLPGRTNPTAGRAGD